MSIRKNSINASPLGEGSEQSEVLSVTALNRQVKRLLEVNYSSVKVEGELSNVVKPRSGHYYFTLKDEGAQVRCAMFRSRAETLKFTPKEGDLVLVRGRVGLYEPRGDYQLVVDSMRPAGEGALRLAFERLKHKLMTQGWFEEEHKKELPTIPKTIAVVTSPTGAAIRDILSVLRRRFPAVPVMVVPVSVQGDGAASAIAEAIKTLNKEMICDVMIVGRGGGSLEDLWCFNDEGLAQAIFESSIPVISAVGHEIDFTIADFVADVRAPTPSVAAELAVPDQAEWQSMFQNYEQFFEQFIRRSLALKRQQWEALKHRLRHPGHQLQERAQRLDDLNLRLISAMRVQLIERRSQLQNHKTVLYSHRLDFLIEKKRWGLQKVHQRLIQVIQEQVKTQQRKLELTAALLNNVSPLATLKRGYSLCHNEDEQLVRDADDVSVGEKVTITPAKGRLLCQVIDHQGDNLET